GGQSRVGRRELAGPAGREDAEHLVRRRGRDAASRQLLHVDLVGDGGPGEGAPGDLGGQAGDVVEGERARRGERRRRAVEAALVGQDRGGRGGQVVVRGPADRPVGGQRDVTRPRGVAQQLHGARGVEAVAQRGERHAGRAQRVLRGG